MSQAKGSGIYNVIVIGAGTAGLVTAAGTAGLGGRVALIERNKMGGDCLNFGCVPSKALISSARLVQQVREAEKWGLERQSPQFVFEKVFDRMRARRAQIAPNDSQERFESLGVDVFRGEAHFVSPYEVEVAGQTLRARNFAIATGSRATIPKIEGIAAVPYLTNETVFDELIEKPESMIVLGGGPIGCELGQAFARLGVKVTIVQSAPQLLPPEDQDVAAFMQEQFVGEGVQVRLSAAAKRVSQHDGKVVLEFQEGDSVMADAILVAAGRTPNLRALDLQTAGVDYDEHGVKVNEFLQTSQRHIYAAGDITNRLKFTHTADFTARIVVRNILVPLQLLRQKVNWSIVPWCTFTEPEVAHVGLGVKEAQKNGIAYDRFRVELKDVDRAVVESEETGFAKILTRKGSDEILGVTIVAPHAGDLLHEFVVAMHARVGLGKIASMIHVYPTVAELARKAGDQFNRTRLTPRAKKIFAWLYARQR
jgi:pyruvate/2-oxoglutarate dehydrogenase complex dihydrolipoamide dehydrogenase (E3) component